MHIGQYNGYHIRGVCRLCKVNNFWSHEMRAQHTGHLRQSCFWSMLKLISSEVNLSTASAGLFTLRQCLISYNHSQYSSNIGHEPNNLVHCKGQVMQRCVSFWTLPFGAAGVFIWSKLSLLLISELSGKPRFCSLLGYLISFCWV